ncbi:MAG: sigma-54 interaction domain-containing protein [Planctomycetota bacterium]
MSEHFHEVASQLVRGVAEGQDRETLLQTVLGECCAPREIAFAAVVRFEAGEYRYVARCGAASRLPYELFSHALEMEKPCSEGPWEVAPLPVECGAAHLLALKRAKAAGHGVSSRQPSAALLAGWIAAAWTATARQERQRRRIERLEALLDILVQWGQTLETGKLLEQIAEAATRLLGAERASVFLWDRETKTLIGRPALGIDGDELRLSDDAGVVGQVIQSGRPHRVDLDAGQQRIDRRVDQQLGFQTRTLLCVPLRGRDGRLFGAFELINKIAGDFTDEDELAATELATHAAVALESTQQYEKLLRSRNQMADEAAVGVELVGECPAMEALRATITRVAHTELAILILGENGTGKEIAARCIHYLSPRRNEPFIAVNCAALTETLLESELFGHEKGAFTDAHETRAGKFELADGGTLFLDEIGDMSPGGQAKLLRVLEEKLVVRVGGSIPVHTNARIVAATNQDLAELVNQKKFRQDLYFRLNVVTLNLPPLRDRGDDILLLAERFLDTYCRQARRKPPRLTAAARKRLLGHSWPGNVRELRNLMERIAYLSSGDSVGPDELPFIASPQQSDTAWLPADTSLADATRQFQIQFIQKQIQRAHGNMTSAAERLGLHRANLYRKMRRLDMETDPQ